MRSRAALLLACVAALAACATARQERCPRIQEVVKRAAEPSDRDAYCAQAIKTPLPERSLTNLASGPHVVTEVRTRYPGACSESPRVTVTLAVYIDETGAVTATTVLRSAGAELDAAAADAMSRFKFTPGCTGAGRPTASFVSYEYVFELSN